MWGGFHKWGVPLNHPFLDGILAYKSSIWRYPPFKKAPNILNILNYTDTVSSASWLPRSKRPIFQQGTNSCPLDSCDSRGPGSDSRTYDSRTVKPEAGHHFQVTFSNLWRSGSLKPTCGGNWD